VDKPCGPAQRRRNQPGTSRAGRTDKSQFRRFFRKNGIRMDAAGEVRMSFTGVALIAVELEVSLANA